MFLPKCVGATKSVQGQDYFSYNLLKSYTDILCAYLLMYVTFSSFTFNKQALNLYRDF